MAELIKTNDGSNTLYSSKYDQHYHNVDEGAINESLYKHIIPALEFHKDKSELNILDICFGLGYNTLSTIYFIKKHKLNFKVNIYSPELDGDLIKSLSDFEYPKEFEDFKEIINCVSNTNKYEDDFIKIEVHVGDARDYIRSFESDFFDIIYQDAFSSEVNMELWTKEYFDDLYKISNEDSIMTTYAIATPVRLSMYEAKYNIYEYAPIKRKNTLCFVNKQDQIGKFIDMELKKERNKDARAIYD